MLDVFANASILLLAPTVAAAGAGGAAVGGGPANRAGCAGKWGVSVSQALPVGARGAGHQDALGEGVAGGHLCTARKQGEPRKIRSNGDVVDDQEQQEQADGRHHFLQVDRCCCMI
jgi:hypothetical protein